MTLPKMDFVAMWKDLEQKADSLGKEKQLDLKKLSQIANDKFECNTSLYTVLLLDELFTH